MLDFSTQSGLAHVRTARPVAEALRRVEELATARGLTIFARIDFAADADRAGLRLPPTALLVLGNPRAGTPLMQAVPTSAIDLPLKVLAWQDADGQAWLSYNTPEYLRARHGLPESLVANIAGLARLVEAAAQ